MMNYLKLVAAGCLATLPWGMVAQQQRPNIIVINIDDLAASEPQRTASLYAVLNNWKAAVSAPIPTDLNPKYKAYKEQ